MALSLQFDQLEAIMLLAVLQVVPDEQLGPEMNQNILITICHTQIKGLPVWFGAVLVTILR